MADTPWFARLQQGLRTWRRSLKARLPYVRRRELRKVEARADQLARELIATPDLATSARLDTLFLRPAAGREVCLFVSHAPVPRVKHHVRVHIRAFRAAGFEVLLVLNTPHAATQFTVDDELAQLCRGVFVRENKGFDFGAWAHLAQSVDLGPTVERVALVNDSLLGPVDLAAFDRLIDRIRHSSADVLGLTRNLALQPHLQSFFLVFQHAALTRGLFTSTMRVVRNLRTKDDVIGLYENYLTTHLQASGLRCEAVFPPLSDDPHRANDTLFRWEALLHQGFPYVKVSLLADPATRAQARMQSAMSGELVRAWELEQETETEPARHPR